MALSDKKKTSPAAGLPKEALAAEAEAPAEVEEMFDAAELPLREALPPAALPAEPLAGGWQGERSGRPGG